MQSVLQVSGQEVSSQLYQHWLQIKWLRICHNFINTCWQLSPWCFCKFDSMCWFEWTSLHKLWSSLSFVLCFFQLENYWPSLKSFSDAMASLVSLNVVKLRVELFQIKERFILGACIVFWKEWNLTWSDIWGEQIRIFLENDTKRIFKFEFHET